MSDERTVTEILASGVRHDDDWFVWNGCWFG